MANIQATRMTSIKEELKKTFFLVQANTFEMQCLWEKHQTTIPWESEGCGLIEEIGKLDGWPVMLSIFWHTIDGHRIAFWESTSRVVDYGMIDGWFAEQASLPKWDNGHRDARCNAMNFHLCLAAIREANERVTQDN